MTGFGRTVGRREDREMVPRMILEKTEVFLFGRCPLVPLVLRAKSKGRGFFWSKATMSAASVNDDAIRTTIYEHARKQSALVLRRPECADDVDELAHEVWLVADKRWRRGELDEKAIRSFCRVTARKMVFGRKRMEPDYCDELPERVWDSCGMLVIDPNELEDAQTLVDARLALCLHVAAHCDPLVAPVVGSGLTGYSQDAKRMAIKRRCDRLGWKSRRRKHRMWKNALLERARQFGARFENALSPRSTESVISWGVTQRYIMSELQKCLGMIAPFDHKGRYTKFDQMLNRDDLLRDYFYLDDVGLFRLHVQGETIVRSVVSKLTHVPWLHRCCLQWKH